MTSEFYTSCKLRGYSSNDGILKLKDKKEGRKSLFFGKVYIYKDNCNSGTTAQII